MSTKAWRPLCCVLALLLLLIAIAQLPNVSQYVQKVRLFAQIHPEFVDSERQRNKLFLENAAIF